MTKSLITKFIGTKHQRTLKKLQPVVDAINHHSEAYRDLSDGALAAKTEEFKARLAGGEALDDLLPEAFAAVKETCRRRLGMEWDVTGQRARWDMVPFDVQLLGAIVLHEGRIAEMATGEGKTLVATMPLYLNALEGKGAHLVTVNDYLARRDREWMGPIYESLGLTVGVIHHDMDPESRKAAYACDITYGTNNEFGFDYLRDNMSLRLEDRVQRGHHYAIVDEVDSVLIDEARTPLIISGPVSSDEGEQYSPLKPKVEQLVKRQVQVANRLVAEAEEALERGDMSEAGVKLLQVSRGMPKNKRFMKLSQEKGVKKLIQNIETDYMREKRLHELDEELHFAMDEKGHNVHLSDKGLEVLSPGDHDMFVLPDLAELIHSVESDPTLSPKAKAERRMEVERDFAQRSEAVHAIHQLLKAYSLFERDVEYLLQDGKVVIVDEFTGRLMPGRRYSDGLHQAIEAKEGVKVEGETQTLATITIQNYFRLYDRLAGMTGTAETEEKEFWEIYKLDVVVVPTNRPVRRMDMDDVVYRTKREKYNAIIEEIEEYHRREQPVLVGTVSVDVSETLSRMLKRRGIKHHVLNAKHHQREAEIVSHAGQPGAVTIATNMAGRGTDIKLGPGVVRCQRCGIIPLPEWGNDHSENVPEGWTVRDCRRRPASGLHVIGTERHEARRIDRQLRGRSGRQGDPGSSRFFLSLEDDLMRLFGSERIATIMDKLGAEEGEVITHPLVTRSIGRAQRKVEAHNFEIRKHLLEYDDVMNRQREVIYDLRLLAQKGEGLVEEVQGMIEPAVEEKAEALIPETVHPDDWDLEGLRTEIARDFLVDVSQPIREAGNSTREALIGAVRDRVVQAYRERLEELGEEKAQFLLQRVLLLIIDEKWRDHLYELDHLKTGITYRAWGQKDPLIEYKKEAFHLFSELVSEINHDVGSLFFRAQLVETPPPAERRPPRRMVAHRSPLPVMAAAGAAGPGGEAEEVGPTAPIVREGEKVGRNDPCPCGSGLKYKKCHGR